MGEETSARGIIAAVAFLDTLLQSALNLRRLVLPTPIEISTSIPVLLLFLVLVQKGSYIEHQIIVINQL